MAPSNHLLGKMDFPNCDDLFQDVKNFLRHTEDQYSMALPLQIFKQLKSKSDFTWELDCLLKQTLALSLVYVVEHFCQLEFCKQWLHVCFLLQSMRADQKLILLFLFFQSPLCLSVSIDWQIFDRGSVDFQSFTLSFLLLVLHSVCVAGSTSFYFSKTFLF